MMNNFTQISIGNVKRIKFNKFEKDFSFIVNGKVYKTNSFVANILSPNISKKLQENMNLAYYLINTKEIGDFNRIIKYGEMKTINIKEEENQYFTMIMKQLGNINEALRFSKEFQGEISYENVIQRIKTKKQLNVNSDKEIAYISSNFHDFHTKNPESIFELDVDTIEQIITNDQLKLFNEDELLDIILKLYIKSKEYSILFSYIIFMNLSTQSIKEFNTKFDINDINNSIWESIRCRLEQDISFESKIAYKKSHRGSLNKRYTIKRYEHIIQHLSKYYHGNVHVKNAVQIISSSKYDDGEKVKNIVEQNNKDFATKNEIGSWIQLDFKKRNVLLDSYTLVTFNGNENDEHLKNWILEVSNDGENYKEIDRQENCDFLNGSLNRATFQVSCSTSQRFVCLRQTGKNWGGNYHLNLNQIEFSGFLYE